MRKCLYNSFHSEELTLRELTTKYSENDSKLLKTLVKFNWIASWKHNHVASAGWKPELGASFKLNIWKNKEECNLPFYPGKIKYFLVLSFVYRLGNRCSLLVNFTGQRELWKLMIDR